MGQRKRVLKFGVVYIALIGFIWLADYIPAVLRSMIFMIVLCFRMFMPILLYAQTFIETTAVNEMVTAMYALRLPRSFIITFAVAMRFFPTAKEELGCIRDAMKLRGIRISPRNLAARPSLLLEGFMTPLLVRSSTIADELSAASITRGLDNPAPRTAFVQLHISTADTVVTLLLICALCGVMIVRAFMEGKVF
jgi:energy-coupling factor transport system permease protein